MVLVVLLLDAPAALSLGDGRLHRVGALVGVEHDLAVDVAGGAAHRLDERGLGAQEALLVGVEDGDQRHLGDVEALPEEVDADEHVDVAEAERPDEFVAFERVGLVVHVGHVDAGLFEVLGEVLGHALRECGHQYPFVAVDAVIDAF